MPPATRSARTVIRDRLDELDISLSRASEQLGKNRAYLQQYMERRIPEALPDDVRKDLAQMFAIPERALLADPAGTFKARPGPARLPQQIPTRGRRSTIPVLGIAEGGKEGWSIWNGDTVDRVATPVTLNGVPNAYALYVVGSSMEPRYFAGERIHVHPGKPVTIGSFVAVQVRPESEGEPPRALVKRLARRTASKLVFEQFNPPHTIEVAAKDVVSMHRIVGADE